ncbi:hypothetical protein ZEAMMB73_Zm00001d006910 [Zea mays]|uniref:Uncharacterized protein n=1 Tax=Zea mays TaxID=4577 RepID=A0A1D6F206_MAIZE|nr:hypothetical protein ZEAMMB73_Zm00001d006910 [Zea mays]
MTTFWPWRPDLPRFTAQLWALLFLLYVPLLICAAVGGEIRWI